ncbi:MAG: hypothetical protein LBC18_13710 [Opitutaceae bacterium]|jgi:hypothetical protein|nr:hypothetical protein [Opitutaceae bacterium]
MAPAPLPFSDFLRPAAGLQGASRGPAHIAKCTEAALLQAFFIKINPLIMAEL